MNEFDYLTKGLSEVDVLQKHKLIVGSLLATGDRTVEYNQMICEVQNNGAVIRPVNGQYLTIPMPVAGKRHARDIQGLFFHISKQGKPTLAKEENGKLVVYFLLMKKVSIPARPFLDLSVQKSIGKVTEMVSNGILDIYTHKSTAGEVLDSIGKYLSIQIKKEMAETTTPANAPITQYNKEFNNPLFDTGALQRSISWVVI